MRSVLHLTVVTVFGLTALSFTPASAQSLPGIGGGSNPLSGAAGSMMGNSGTSGMMGGMLPSLSSSSTGNVAGVLSYCVQNNILQGASATNTLSALTSKSGLTSSSDYTAGSQGNIESSNGSVFSLGDVKQQIKTKACNMVLQHAQSLL